jgi:SAM-dependent methyltransferase
VDVGCGSGASLAHLAALAAAGDKPESAECLGLEPSPELAERARRLLASRGHA